ncbi:hypothetical protein ACXHXG_24615 [Rhizobium sp. LEGMi198b]|uniref:hypothetical protein n=1 Tax=unclassified Rhizobium TaxID=2613769 RepID=UPI000CDF43E8|nr:MULTISPECIES: hypothetical protein [Rhizobium]AVA25001.1 hypothetical protein NXC24_PC00556 [Rhizobium sp. NXC24]UWU24778.1 hypothetical protein N2601_21800 [Rhizobium tropici]
MNLVIRKDNKTAPLALRSAAALLCCAIALSSCGGREAHPIASTNVGDGGLDCGGVSREFAANERQILATVKERSQAQGKNVILGATGVLLFWPALFFMDPKSPEKVEIDALRNRNQVLTDLARSRKCPAPKSQLGEVYKRLDGGVKTPPAKRD